MLILDLQILKHFQIHLLLVSVLMNLMKVSDKPVIGISIFSVPLNDTPAILLAVCNLVAVVELPVKLPTYITN